MAILRLSTTAISCRRAYAITVSLLLNLEDGKQLSDFFLDNRKFFLLRYSHFLRWGIVNDFTLLLLWLKSRVLSL